MSKHMIHRYVGCCSWRGSTGLGYKTYDRTHDVWAEPAEQRLKVASDAAFRGNAKLLNPEQLVVMAASSCQLLSFLAVAARAGLDVVAYSDQAIGTMAEEDEPVRLNEIRLHPSILVVEGPTEVHVRELVHQAHEECYIANSLKTAVIVDASIEFIPKE